MNGARECFAKQLLPPPRAFYEREIGKLTRPSRGWSRGRCPFHQSKSGTSFSVNFDSGAFHCFGCEAAGSDIVDFVRLRDRVDFKAACKSLGAWKSATPAETARLKSADADNKRKRERETAKQQAITTARRQCAEEMRELEHIIDRTRQRLDSSSTEQESELAWQVMANAQDCLNGLYPRYEELCRREDAIGTFRVPSIPEAAIARLTNACIPGARWR